MANALHSSIKGFLLDADYDFSSATLKVSLIDADDVTINPASHDFYDDISAGVVATATLSGVTTSADGKLDSTDPTFAAATGDTSEELELWIDTAGAASTDPLVANYDTFTSGMPVTPNSGDIEVIVHANGYFSL